MTANRNYLSTTRSFLINTLILLLSLGTSFYLAPYAGFIPNVYLGGGLETITVTDALRVLTVMLVFHWIGFGLTVLVARGMQVDGKSSGLFTHLAIFVTANTAAVLYLFLFTDLTFVVRFYALTFVVYPVLSVGRSVISYDRHKPQALTALDSLWKSVSNEWLSLWGAAAVVSVVAFGTIFAMFYLSLDFRNQINVFRATNLSSEVTDWVLEPLCRDASFDRPIDLEIQPGSGTTYLVLERTGVVKTLTADCTVTKVLDFSQRVSSLQIENGALAIAAHPGFTDDDTRSNQYLFAYYTGKADGINVVRLSRFDLSHDDPEEQILIEQERNDTGFHNGGTLLFDSDGFLYWSTGEQSNSSAHQRLDIALAGGIMKLDVDQRGGGISRPIRNRAPGLRSNNYYIPLDNPFVGIPGALEEYWALGLRNPFRVWLDDATGEIWVGDVGEDTFEEVSVLRKGDNGQYPVFEGPMNKLDREPVFEFGNPVEPVYYYRQTAVLRAVIGGGIYRGFNLPELTGTYVFADNQAGFIYRWDYLTNSEPEIIATSSYAGQNGITSFAFSDDGEVLVTALGSSQQPSGLVARLRPAGEGTASGPQMTEMTPYDRYCVRCHGEDGKGEGAKALVATAPDFTDNAWQARVSDERIVNAVNGGGAAVGLSATMPAWEGAFSEAELKEIVEQIRSFAD